MAPTVLKLGGSLLDLPDLGRRVQQLIERAAIINPVIVPGGGPTADLIRGWQPQFGWNNEQAHWLAIDSLDFNAHVLAETIPGGVVVNDRATAERVWSQHRIPVLAPKRWLWSAEQDATSRGPEPLPHVWEVTSDSLAAWIAVDWPATILILLKSTPKPMTGEPVVGASSRGLVDGYFPGLCGSVPRIAWVNLRNDQPSVETWLINGLPPGPCGPDVC